MSRKLAVLFRYGAGEHVDFLPALPDICRRMSEKGWEVHHFGFDGGVPPPDELQEVCTVHVLGGRVDRSPGLDKYVKALLWLAGLPLLGRRLRRQGFDTVFVDETLPLTAVALRLGFKGRLCFTIHDFFSEIYLTSRRGGGWLGRGLNALDARSWCGLDAVFTRVEAAKRYLTAIGLEAERIHVVPDSVDTRQFRPGAAPGVRERLGLSPDDLVVVHHGILHPNKGNVRLVAALDRLRDRLPALRLVIVGDGPEMRALRREVTARNLGGRVVLTGWLPGLPDIAEVLRACDIGLVMRAGVPGDDFHVTSTLVHNLASGLPVLAVRLAGIAESVNEGVEGWLFDPECGEEFDRKLLELAADPDRRREMGRRAREAAATRFARERIAAAYAEVLGG